MDPTYIKPHPTFGAAGTMHIYRFANNLGLVAERHLMRDIGWLVTPVRFIGVEVTNYLEDGKPTPNVDKTALDKMCVARQDIGKAPPPKLPEVHEQKETTDASVPDSTTETE